MPVDWTSFTQRKSLVRVLQYMERLQMLRVYVFESAREKELVFVHKTVYDGEIHPSDELDGGRFWSPDEIKANIGKGVFTPNFEGEIGKVINL